MNHKIKQPGTVVLATCVVIVICLLVGCETSSPRSTTTASLPEIDPKEREDLIAKLTDYKYIYGQQQAIERIIDIRTSHKIRLYDVRVTYGLIDIINQRFKSEVLTGKPDNKANAIYTEQDYENLRRAALSALAEFDDSMAEGYFKDISWMR